VSKLPKISRKSNPTLPLWTFLVHSIQYHMNDCLVNLVTRPMGFVDPSTTGLGHSSTTDKCGWQLTENPLVKLVLIASGVPQGTAVLAHCSSCFSSTTSPVWCYLAGTTTRLFADDCLVYREIKTSEDQVTLQRDE